MSQVYHPGAQWLIDNGNLPEKARNIELQDVRKYVAWRNQNQPLVLIHELTHAYHHRLSYKLNEWQLFTKIRFTRLFLNAFIM